MDITLRTRAIYNPYDLMYRAGITTITQHGVCEPPLARNSVRDGPAPCSGARARAGMCGEAGVGAQQGAL